MSATGTGAPLQPLIPGIEGYTVWSNLYLAGGALVAASETKEAADRLPKPRRVLSDFDGVERVPAGPDLWATSTGADLVRAEFGERAVRLPGVTYLFNDPPGERECPAHGAGATGASTSETSDTRRGARERKGKWLTPDGLIVHHHHFIVDLLVPAARAAAHARAALKMPGEVPARILFPRCGAEPSWRDQRGMSASLSERANADPWLLRTMFPNIVVEDKLTWDDRARGDVTYVFEQVVIVDRCESPKSCQEKEGKERGRNC